MIKDEKLTSVKITQPHFDKFKMACLQDNFLLKSLQIGQFFFILQIKSLRD